MLEFHLSGSGIFYRSDVQPQGSLQKQEAEESVEVLPAKGSPFSEGAGLSLSAS